MGAGDGLGGCHACIKYLMFAFNFIFWLIGCALVGVGIWVLVDDGFKDLATNPVFEYLQYAGITLIVVGGIAMVVGFFGCCGAIRESTCLLAMFFACMLILFLALVAAGVACIVFKDGVIEKALEAFKENVENYQGDAEADASTEIVNLVQKFAGCCGYDGPADYAGKDLPTSCGDNKEGCNSVAPTKLGEHVIVAAGVALGAGAVMLLGMIFSMLLCCAIRDQD